MYPERPVEINGCAIGGGSVKQSILCPRSQKRIQRAVWLAIYGIRYNQTLSSRNGRRDIKSTFGESILALNGLMLNRLRTGLVLMLCCILCFPAMSFGQETPPDAMYIIFDASGSMWRALPDKSRKIDVAKKALQDFVADDLTGYDLALRIYGHRRKGDCADSQLVMPFDTPDKIRTQLPQIMRNLKPLGKTPITFSLTEALKDFGGRRGELILITDGIETCNADPCALVREWRDKQIPINVHVVGLGLKAKEKTALQCISDAAETVFHDARSAQSLAEGLAQIQQQTTSTALKLRGVSPDGEPLPIYGTLIQDGQPVSPVTSLQRNAVNPGAYDLTVGVKTRNGNMYRPVTQAIQVAKRGEITVTVEVPEPPSVKAKFLERGKPQRGALIRAYQGNQEVFAFRPQDRVYVDEGTYEFRTQPNAQNTLTLTASFAAGDHKELVFEMVLTVQITVRMVASESGLWFRENYELWQNGEKKYGVHVHNGARVLPGTYDVHLTNRLTPYVHNGIVVTAETKQHFDITVPAGHVTVVYQNADGSRDSDERCWMQRIGPEPLKHRVYVQSGRQYALRPGTYRVTGWNRKGTYDPVEFDIALGDDKTVALRNRK